MPFMQLVRLIPTSEQKFFLQENMEPDSITIYLNPVYRYSGDKPVKPSTPEINVGVTLIYRIFSFCTLLFIVINIFVFLKRVQKRAK